MNEDSAVKKVKGGGGDLRWKMSLNSGKTEVMLAGKKLAKQEIVRIGQAKVKMRRRIM